MILGDGFLADGARAQFGDVPFDWICDHPTLQPLEGRVTQRIVVISTPVLVGTIARLEVDRPDLTFAYVPENVREAHPEDWTTQARFVVGTRDRQTARYLSKWFFPTITMFPESAEMTKHAINGFLGMSIAYAHRIAVLAAKHGADPDDVAHGMMTDPRIGHGAYLRPVGGISPHVQRELDNLDRL